MTSRVDAFRKYADEYLKQAESAAISEDKEHWLEMAARCMTMAAAEEAEGASTDLSSLRGKYTLEQKTSGQAI